MEVVTLSQVIPERTLDNLMGREKSIKYIPACCSVKVVMGFVICYFVCLNTSQIVGHILFHNPILVNHLRDQDQPD